MDWHTEVTEEEKDSPEEKPIEKEDLPEDEGTKKPEYHDYFSWKDIPDKDKKHYGI